jgi:ABC-2 type transport system permease protein
MAGATNRTISPIMRTAPVYWLTVRQFAAGKAIRVMALFAATPVVFALIYLLQTNRPTGERFLSDLVLNFVTPIVIPLSALILSTGALGNELADRTIPYLALKPVGRWRIVLEKFLGTAVSTAVPILIGLTLTWGVVVWGEGGVGGRTLVALLVAGLAGLLAYSGLFLFISLVIPRALIVGIIYVLLWEGLLAGLIRGIRVLSVRHYTQSIYIHLLAHPPVQLTGAMHLGAAIEVLAVLVVVSLVLATWRLRDMSLD